MTDFDPAQLPIKVYTLGDPPTQDVDPWNYTGNAQYHKHPESRAFIQRCQQALPQRDLPIKMGSTGYVELTVKTPLSEIANGWCYDEVGRAVIIFAGHLLFQRYTEGDVLSINDGTGRLIPLKERLAELATKL